MSTPVIRYQLDLTGTSPDNLVTGEPHAIPVTGNRAFVPLYGPFYAKTLKVYRVSSGQELTRGTQFKAAQLFVDATLKVGQEICALIVIVDETIGNDFMIDYQVLGGDYSTSVFAIQQLIDTLAIDHRAVEWGQIIGKPEQFPPLPHLHDVGDTYGWEYIVAALERVTRAILYGDEQSHNAIYQYIDHRYDELDARLDSAQLTLSNHIQDHSNPHQVTKIQVNLGNVENYAVASQNEAQDGLRNDRYMTPLRTRQSIDIALTPFNSHLQDYGNPHFTTKAQVGLGSVDNYATANSQQAVEGTRNDLFVTPATMAHAIEARASTLIQAHTLDMNNPHQTTKTQVGLGSVDNYATATVQQAIDGNRSDLFVTPAGVAAAVQNGASTALNAHIQDYNNPHQTTKAQIGLGNVQNYGMATTPEAESGTRTDAFMSPALTKAAITAQATNPLNAHTGNMNNPHQTTKAQVGLGNVDNFPTASELEARTGTAVDRFMTPQRTQQAINELAMSKPQAALEPSWGYWRDPATGHTRCWGRTPPLAPGQYFYCHFRRWFTHVFVMTEGGWSRNIDTSMPNNLPNALAEVRARVIQRTVSNRGFAVVAFRDDGTNSDYTVYNWMVEGVSDDSGLGGPNSGQFISAVGWMDDGSTDGYSSGGPSNYIDIGLLGNSGNQTPTANFTYSVNDLTVTFTNTSTDSDGTIASNTWNFGDGATSTLTSPTHTYSAYGSYQVSLAVVDNGSAGSTKTITVFVSNPDGGGGGCVATTMYMDETRLAGDIAIGEWIDGSDAPNKTMVLRQVRDNRVMAQPCYLMTTISGIQIIASESTPMELQDGSSKMFPDMEGELVLVDDNGEVRWEEVASLVPVGMRDVVLFNVDDQSYFAGMVGNRRIATHNESNPKN